VRLAGNDELGAVPREGPNEDPDTGDEIPWGLVEPSTEDVRQQGRLLERRQQEFRAAARRVAAALSTNCMPRRASGSPTTRWTSS
jgi:hypothetical protein